MALETTRNVPTVYLADDAADYQYLVQQVFRQFLPQYALVLFPDGDSLLKHLQLHSVSPSLILLDLHMPGPSGRQTLLQLKQEPAWKTIPVVMITSSTSTNEIQACYEAGANACLTKPIGITSMHQLFEQVCSYWVDTNSV